MQTFAAYVTDRGTEHVSLMFPNGWSAYVTPMNYTPGHFKVRVTLPNDVPGYFVSNVSKPELEAMLKGLKSAHVQAVSTPRAITTGKPARRLRYSPRARMIVGAINLGIIIACIFHVAFPF